MAVLAQNTENTAHVSSVGKENTAVVEMNGSLMDMLSTVYAFILMGAIREAIQNACDAVRRKGVTFADGVMVHLPTVENPVITVTDRGDGMSRAFLESNYMVLGSSTKAGDNGAAGGLGIGRWAAYGYIGEATVTSCDATDMTERTYFMYKSAAGTPATRMASEVLGTQPGTRVSFPVRESDLTEAYMAVRWLKEIMQLTMGDSFAVDIPALLEQASVHHLPEFSGHALELGAFDPDLEGVVVYPMQGSALQYGRAGFGAGSLIVLTNKEAGIGGLPFHVRSITGANSPFAEGCVVELPMRLRIAFMPSREEVKYTDELTRLMRKIDAAANKALLARVDALYHSPSLAKRLELSKLLGTGAGPAAHWGAYWNIVAMDKGDTKELFNILGGSWRGRVPLAVRRLEARGSLAVKAIQLNRGTLSTVNGIHRAMSISVANQQIGLVATEKSQPILVVDDLLSGGVTRLRHLAKTNYLGLPADQLLLLFSAEHTADAKAYAEAMNEDYGHPFRVLLTSELHAPPKVVVGSTLLTVTPKGIMYFSLDLRKQVTEPGSILTPTESIQAYVVKQGGTVTGLKKDYTLADVASGYRPCAAQVLTHLGLRKLYLLTPKEAAELETLKGELETVEEAELSDDERATKALLAQWVPFFDLVQQVIDSPAAVAAREGKLLVRMTGDSQFSSLLNMLAAEPRFELLGTRFDKAISPYLDLANGSIRIPDYYNTYTQGDANLAQLYASLHELAKAVDLHAFSEEQKTKLALMEGADDWGHVNYLKIHADLVEKFPLISAGVRFNKEGRAHFARALAHLYA